MKIDESIFEPWDFFISHKHAQEPDEQITDPLVTALKARGYRVWYDKDTWGTEAGKVSEWAKRGIDQARHCITVLCKQYFNVITFFPFQKQILTTKDPKNVFQIGGQILRKNS
ncbi:MAG: toll/interleukin-1 receptor domain-containing protein [Candidatus Hermodarchaeota archaeon]